MNKPLKYLVWRGIGSSLVSCLLGLAALLPAIGVGKVLVPIQFDILIERMAVVIVMIGSLSAFLGLVQCILLAGSFVVGAWEMSARGACGQYGSTDSNKLYVQIVLSVALLQLPIWGVVLLPYYASGESDLLLKVLVGCLLGGTALTIEPLVVTLGLILMSVVPSRWLLWIARNRIKKRSKDLGFVFDARCENDQEPGPDMFRVGK